MGRPGTIAAAALLLAGCAAPKPVLHAYLAANTAAVELTDTPFYPQEDYQCGPAALATLLSTAGVTADPERLAQQVYLPEKQGSLQVELIAASRRHGRIPYVIQPTVAALAAELAADRPVLVLQNLGTAHYPIWHYAVVIGFDAVRDEIVLRSGRTYRKTLRFAKFKKYWDRAGRWGLVVLRPGELPERLNHDAYLQALAAMEVLGHGAILGPAYGAALARWPQSEIALLGLGNAHYARGELEQAELQYRRLLEQRPNHAAARNNLAQVLADRGCHEAALGELEAALAVVAENEIRAALVRTQEELRRVRAAPTGGSARCPKP